MKAVFIKSENGFVPACDESLKLFEKVGCGEGVMVEFIKSRNYQFHKKFFAFVNTTFDMQDSFTDIEIWRKNLQIMAGHYDAVITPVPKQKERLFSYLKNYLGGKRKEEVIDTIANSYKVNLMPKSISFSEMDETEFEKLYGRMITAFIEYFGNGMTENELYEVLDYV